MDFAKVKSVRSPERAGAREAGIDFYVPDDAHYEISEGESIMIPLGVHVKVPTGHALIFFNKSGVAAKKGLKVGACVIDETYQGELILNLFKDSVAGSEVVDINGGEKIIQGLIVPINYGLPVEKDFSNLYAEATQRGDSGYGSGYKEEIIGKAGEVADLASKGIDSAKESLGNAVGSLKNLFKK